jgi:hypothetical protein
MKGLARAIKGFAYDLGCIVIERRTLEKWKTSAIGAWSLAIAPSLIRRGELIRTGIAQDP